MVDSEAYRAKKEFFDQVLTIYGRKPVLEAVRDRSLQCHALHLARSNRDNAVLREILQVAGERDVGVRYHSREALARISRNGKQDQGVALDILCPAFQALDGYLANLSGVVRPQRLLALDGITNPQNLGMIVRSATAAGMDGIIWSRRGNAALGPLVVKASAGTLFRAPMLLTPLLEKGLNDCRSCGIEIGVLTATAERDLFRHRPSRHCVYVLGNETEGVSRPLVEMADIHLAIPMKNGVESLNVAVTASLIAYAGYFDR